MDIPSQIKTQYIKQPQGYAAETLQIVVGRDFELKRGDTIVVYPKKAGKVHIKRKESSVPKGFNPWYAQARE